VADIEILALLAQVGGPQAHRKERAAELLDHSGEGLPGRKFTPARLLGAALGLTPAITDRVQARHHLVEIPMLGPRIGDIGGPSPGDVRERGRQPLLLEHAGGTHAGRPAASKTPSNSTELR